MATVAIKSEYAFFLEQLATSQKRLLMLDYDGTLAPFTEQRSKAVPYAGVRELLNQIALTSNTRLVFVTGRSAADIPRLLPLDKSAEVWGVYGLERFHADGRQEIGFLPSTGLKAIAEAKSWLLQSGFRERTEDKIGAVAVHWRGSPAYEVERIRAECYRKLAQLACSAKLTLSEFDGGLELRLPGCDKAHAVQAIISETDDDVPIAFLGDDASDETAFRALNGRGLTVLVRPVFRATAAEVWLRPPQQLLRFLEDWLRACGGVR